ncbi:pilus assembly protein PilM [Patescibacteria group bacterium]|nr:pilus assembly protein PilM [Patescibacteria group bacterium]MBU1663643.1 pilus assembly protein PilM [Patescibacteria group bacterium]MBU1934226.1 pilus assembly protein PilM [Patescibacteria group bacterium]MBU2007935.1 pilus assembly protein PilM [Patescibacteria group bacterium]MBU2233278.1 pilus assembly protein PilM [Patescibacteria group bacterium]
MMLIKGSSSPIGLDISDLSIKLVQLDKSRDKIKIQALSKLNLPQGIIVNGEIKNKAELIKAIKKIIADPLYGKVSSEKVVACLPESKTFIKLIEIQKSPNHLADIIGSEIEKHVPMELNEIYYDWQIIEELTDKYLVLIGATPKNIVNQYTDLLDQAKLSPIALEIEPISICRSLLKEETFSLKPIAGDNLNYGIIDIGANHACMIFYSGHTILFTVSMPISGEEITAKISQTLDLTKEQAEKAKIICGLDENKANGVIKNILTDNLKNLMEKIKEAISFYENYFNQRGPLNQILLCGGGANMLNLKKIISKKFSVEVKLADALTNLSEEKNEFDEIFAEKHTLDFKLIKLDSDDKQKNLSIKQNSSATFATAIGLALREIFIDEL